MDLTPRTVLRAFLLVGGIAVLGLGIIEESLVQIGIGVVAMLLGGFGLYTQYKVSE